MHCARSLAFLFGTTLVTALPSGFKWSTRDGISHGITDSSSAVDNKTFDYIIAGGGLTGLAVASRLTEDPNITVLVIENGYDNHTSDWVNDVTTYGDAFETDLDYSFRSTPVASQNNTQLLMVAGKMLGGSGSLNGASWTKGAKSQYDLLPELTGDGSWGWEPFNNFMRDAENFHEPTADQQNNKGAKFDADAHGSGGPVQVSFGAKMFGGTQLPALEASQNLWKNLSRNPDAASGFVNGATIIPNMVVVEPSQNRSSPFTAYAQHQVQQRSNFLILVGHRVTEVVWQDNLGSDLVASGVHFQSSRNSSVNFVQASREVLLAAGSLQSPQILELSGVGDAKVLEAAGVDVKLELPGVGKHMQEQTKNTQNYHIKGSVDFNGTGPPSAVTFLTAQHLLGNETEAWYSNTTQNLAEYADHLYNEGLVANATATHKILQAQLDNVFHAEDSAAAEVFFTITKKENWIGIDNWSLIPLSRGTVHIATNSSWDYPVIEPSYFDHPLDLAFQVALNRQSREVMQTYPLSEYVDDEVVPGVDRVALDAGEREWEEWVRGTFTSVWHYIATLSMTERELGGVVGSDLKVYGVGNVRVVDASVLPIQLSAHLSSSLYGIAEKAAVAIQSDQ